MATSVDDDLKHKSLQRAQEDAELLFNELMADLQKDPRRKISEKQIQSLRANPALKKKLAAILMESTRNPFAQARQYFNDQARSAGAGAEDQVSQANEAHSDMAARIEAKPKLAAAATGPGSQPFFSDSGPSDSAPKRPSPKEGPKQEPGSEQSPTEPPSQSDRPQEGKPDDSQAPPQAEAPQEDNAAGQSGAEDGQSNDKDKDDKDKKKKKEGEEEGDDENRPKSKIDEAKEKLKEKFDNTKLGQAYNKAQALKQQAQETLDKYNPKKRLEEAKEKAKEEVKDAAKRYAKRYAKQIGKQALRAGAQAGAAAGQAVGSALAATAPYWGLILLGLIVIGTFIVFVVVIVLMASCRMTIVNKLPGLRTICQNFSVGQIDVSGAAGTSQTLISSANITAEQRQIMTALSEAVSEGRLALQATGTTNEFCVTVHPGNQARDLACFEAEMLRANFVSLQVLDILTNSPNRPYRSLAITGWVEAVSHTSGSSQHGPAGDFCRQLQVTRSTCGQSIDFNGVSDGTRMYDIGPSCPAPVPCTPEAGKPLIIAFEDFLFKATAEAGLAPLYAYGPEWLVESLRQKYPRLIYPRDEDLRREEATHNHVRFPPGG